MHGPLFYLVRFVKSAAYSANGVSGHGVITEVQLQGRKFSTSFRYDARGSGSLSKKETDLWGEKFDSFDW